MNENKLRSLDTTALLVFHTLLEQSSVSKTAWCLNLTQSAVSHALNRLRGIWDDALFVRMQGRMQPTRKALALAPGVATVIKELNALVHLEQSFDPEFDRRLFVIGMSDYAAAIYLPALSTACAKYMDRITFLVRPTSRASGFAMLERGDVECLVGNFPKAPKTMRQRFLFRDDFVCAMANTHPLAADEWTLHRYLSAQHVHVSLSGEPLGWPDQGLKRIGRQRHVALTMGHFMVLPHVLERSLLLATEPRSLLEPLAEKFHLKIRPPPFEIDTFSFSSVCLGRSDDDPGMNWLISVLQSINQTPTTTPEALGPCGSSDRN